MPHIHEKIDFTADVLIVYQKYVLLRMHDKYGKWFPPGGHIELDEDPNQAAIREAREVVGLDIKLHPVPEYQGPNGIELVVPTFLNRHRISDSHEHVSLIFLATADTHVLTPGTSEKPVELRWFTFSDLRDPKSGVEKGIVLYATTALLVLGEV